MAWMAARSFLRASGDWRRMKASGCSSMMTSIFVVFIEHAQGIIFAFTGLGVVDGFHGRRVGQNLHLLQQVRHPLPWHDEGDDFALPGDGGRFSGVAWLGELLLPLGDGQCILHMDST